MDKTIRVYRRGEEPSDLADWLARTPRERIRAVTEIRNRVYALDPGLPRRLPRVLRVVRRARVEFLIVDGYAVGFHGHPRFTGDLEALGA